MVQYNFGKRTSLLAEYVLNNQNAIGGSTYTKFFSEKKLLTDDRRANYQADPGLPNSTSKSQYGRVVFTHEFNSNWKITSQSSYTKVPSDIWSFLAEETGYNAVGFDSNGISHRLSFRAYNRNEVKATQLFVNGKFKTGKNITHYILTGDEYFVTKDSTYQSYGTKSYLLNIKNLQYGLNRDSLQGKQATFNGFRYDNKYYARYLYYTVDFGGKWIITGGTRYTYNRRENSGVYTPKPVVLSQDAFTPRVGVTYRIDKSTAVYALYDQSFVPTGGQDRLGKLFEPVRGADKEIGVKKNWFGDRLSTSVTGFNIARNNMLTVDPVDRRFNVQLGQVKSKGVEIDVIGNIGSSLSVSANYAYTKVKITKSNTPTQIGQLYASAPQQVANAWLRYAFPTQLLPGLSIALGETTIIKKATTTPGTFIPDYTKLDGAVAYTRGKIIVRLLFDNLTNTRYIQAGDIYDHNGYYTEGMPFNFKVSAGIRL